MQVMDLSFETSYVSAAHYLEHVQMVLNYVYSTKQNENIHKKILSISHASSS